MSASQQTTNYNLPKFAGADKPAWLVDFNGAMETIDTSIKTIEDLSSGLSGQVSQNTSDITDIETSIGNLTSSVASLAVNKAPITNPNFLGVITFNGISMLDIIYPVGSIYLTVGTANPAILFGGTWTSFGAGKTLVGIDPSDPNFDTLEETGGEKTHQLSIDEMPTHNHLLFNSLGLSSGGTIDPNYVAGANTSSGVTTASNAHLKGGNIGHNNLQPYIVTHMWKRTA